MPTFNTLSEVEGHIKKCMSAALKTTAKVLRDELVKFIESDFYSMYSPKVYVRTYQLRNSPDFEVLSETVVEILINTGSMGYSTDSGDYVASLAAQGYHGSPAIFREGFFWRDFLNYCGSNLISVYKTELQKQGLEVG